MSRGLAGLSAGASQFVPASHEAEMRRLRQSNKDLKRAMAGMKVHKKHMEKHALSLQKKNSELEMIHKGIGEEQRRVRNDICRRDNQAELRSLSLHREIGVLKHERKKSEKLYELKEKELAKINEAYLKLQGDARRSTREAKEARDRVDRLVKCVDNLRTTINNQDRLLVVDRGQMEKWQRTSLRLDWLIREMEKVGAVRVPDHSWATEMRHDIEYPDDDGVNRGRSIYGDINVAIRRDCLPDYGDADIEAIGEEEERRRYEEWSQEASAYVASLESSENESDMEHAERILELKIAAAKTIQRYYRGFRSRGHITFTYAEFGGESALQPVQVINEDRLTWYRQDHIFRRESCDPTRFMRRNITRDDAISIRLINTGVDTFKVNWLNRRGGLAKSFRIGPRTYLKSEDIMSYNSHCALITNMRTNTMKIVRMSKVHGLKMVGQYTQDEYRSMYDVNTNITLPFTQSVMNNLRARNYYYSYDSTDADFRHPENYESGGVPFFSAKLQYVVPELVQPYWKCLGYQIDR